MGDEEEEIAPRIIEEEAKNVMVDVGPLEDFLCSVAPTLLDADPKEFRQAVLQVVPGPARPDRSISPTECALSLLGWIVPLLHHSLPCRARCARA